MPTIVPKRVVGELMNPDVVALQPDLPVPKAQALLADRSVSGAPVVDDSGRIVGVVSQNDLVRSAAHPDSAGHRGVFFTSDADFADLGETLLPSSALFVRDVMSRRVHHVARDTGVAIAANIMRERRIHRLLVTERGLLVGVVTSLDLLRVVEELC
jgi:CBS domain-containing protein